MPLDAEGAVSVAATSGGDSELSRALTRRAMRRSGVAGLPVVSPMASDACQGEYAGDQGNGCAFGVDGRARFRLLFGERHGCCVRPLHCAALQRQCGFPWAVGQAWIKGDGDAACSVWGECDAGGCAEGACADVSGAVVKVECLENGRRVTDRKRASSRRRPPRGGVHSGVEAGWIPRMRRCNADRRLSAGHQRLLPFDRAAVGCPAEAGQLHEEVNRNAPGPWCGPAAGLHFCLAAAAIWSACVRYALRPAGAEPSLARVAHCFSVAWWSASGAVTHTAYAYRRRNRSR